MAVDMWNCKRDYHRLLTATIDPFAHSPSWFSWCSLRNSVFTSSLIGVVSCRGRQMISSYDVFERFEHWDFVDYTPGILSLRELNKGGASTTSGFSRNSSDVKTHASPIIPLPRGFVFRDIVSQIFFQNNYWKRFSL